MRSLSRILLPIFSILVLAAPTRSETYLIDPYGTGDFPTIQAAIDGVAEGDVIVLTDGTFEGEGNRGIYFWNKSVKIRSVSGDPSRTVIDCGGVDRAFIIGGPDESGVSLEWFTIQNGLTEANGAAIRCWNSSPSFVGLVFSGNDAVGPNLEGGAVFCQDSSPSFVDVVFDQNRTLGEGSRGGGVFIDRGNPTFEHCTFNANESPKGGAGAFMESGPVFEDCSFLGNASGYGGALFFEESSTGELEECLFDGNRTDLGNQSNHGGAIYCLFSDLTCRTSRFSENTAPSFDSDGGGSMWEEA